VAIAAVWSQYEGEIERTRQLLQRGTRSNPALAGGGAQLADCNEIRSRAD